MTAARLRLSADGEHRAIFESLVRLPWYPPQPPSTITIANKDMKVTSDWLERIRATDLQRVFVAWPRADGEELGGPSLEVFRGEIVLAFVPDHPPIARELVDLVTGLPVEVVTAGHPTSEWKSRSPRFTFSRGHTDHGWGVVFKGRGHDRLVSRRWSEHGPWLVHRDGPPITCLQFCDLDATADEAWQQAVRAHERIGLADSGGYLSPDLAIATRISGLYKAADRSFTVTRGNGQPMAQREMLDLCAYRARMCGDEKEPIERVRVLFLEERDARRHLHELWLRELECWYVDGEGREVRADEGYAPERIRPEWVERAEGVAPAARATSVRFERGLAQLAGALGDWARDDLLFHLLDHHDPGGGYCVREILDAEVPRVSASAGETGELVVSVQQGVGGAMADGARILEAARAVAARVETWVPAERLGLTLPAVIVPDPYVDQRPIRIGDDPPLRGVVVHGVGDVLARVRSLNREDLRELEALLGLCQEQRLVVSARDQR